jgi:flagellar hook protein FlgE
MSLIGSLNAAVGGLDGQAAALAAISNNVANSSTNGFKETDTSFDNFVTQVGFGSNISPGSVVAVQNATNSVAGGITTSANPTSLAISGAGFFPVQLPIGTPGSGPITYNPQQFYTQAGDFSPNVNGTLQNSEGYVLDGFPATNAAGTSFNTNALGPIQISQAPSPPVPTSTISLGANLPSTPTPGTTSFTQNVPIVDADGNSQNLVLNYSQVNSQGPISAANPVTAANPIIPNQWDLTITGSTAPAGAPATTGPLLITFGATPTTAGTIQSIAAAPTDPGNTAPATQNPGDSATINVAANFGLGAQPIALNLGQFGSTSGLTQFSGTSFAPAAPPIQNGLAQGDFNGVTIQPSGNVVINFTNGATKTIAQIPLANFNNANGLQAQSGQAFTATADSGPANIVTAGTNGTGTLEVGAVEGSNVDIATEFTQLIVAQQAYSANSKVITTANNMLQSALNLIQQ